MNITYTHNSKQTITCTHGVSHVRGRLQIVRAHARDLRLLSKGAKGCTVRRAACCNCYNNVSVYRWCIMILMIIHIYIYIYVYTDMHIYIYIYRERERCIYIYIYRERERVVTPAVRCVVLHRVTAILYPITSHRMAWQTRHLIMHRKPNWYEHSTPRSRTQVSTRILHSSAALGG